MGSQLGNMEKLTTKLEITLLIKNTLNIHTLAPFDSETVYQWASLIKKHKPNKVMAQQFALSSAKQFFGLQIIKNLVKPSKDLIQMQSKPFKWMESLLLAKSSDRKRPKKLKLLLNSPALASFRKLAKIWPNTSSPVKISWLTILREFCHREENNKLRQLKLKENRVEKGNGLK